MSFLLLLPACCLLGLNPQPRETGSPIPKVENVSEKGAASIWTSLDLAPFEPLVPTLPFLSPSHGPQHSGTESRENMCMGRHWLTHPTGRAIHLCSASPAHTFLSIPPSKWLLKVFFASYCPQTNLTQAQFPLA